MRAKVEKLPIIFRMWQGEVLALFPTLVEGPGLILSYMHVGQHGAALNSMAQAGRLATPEEFAPLLAELRGIYETSYAPGDPVIKLRVVKRRPSTRNR